MSQKNLFEKLGKRCPDGRPCGQRGLIKAQNSRNYCICCGRAMDNHFDDGWMSRKLAFQFKEQVNELGFKLYALTKDPSFKGKSESVYNEISHIRSVES